MKYILFTLHGYSELFKKRGEKTLFEFAKKENFENFMGNGFWGYTILEKTVEKSYFSFLNIGESFPGEGFIRALKYSISKKENDNFFLCQFVFSNENYIIETDIYLNPKEKQKLLEEIAITQNDFDFFIFKEDILLKYNCPNLPLIENLFPNKIKNKSINELQYKKEGFEKINKLMTDSFKILNKSIINKVRMDLNEPVANFLYVYGMGKLKEKIDVYEKIKKRVLFYSNSEILEGLRIFFNIEKVHKIPEIEEGILYWFNFSLNLNDSPSIWVKNFEIFAKDVLEKIQYREDTRFLFIFDPFMNENYEYEKSLSIFLAVNFSKKIKKKYKNSAFLFKNFID